MIDYLNVDINLPYHRNDRLDEMNKRLVAKIVVFQTKHEERKRHCKFWYKKQKQKQNNKDVKDSDGLKHSLY
ncbi:hypothetical protein BpHYR1_041663 [Brachionus plicatilis]|uniref:Uncharacterized protein n=1 Tax=Brachionus plicatilis TaxID=10195 RepID=A0A3M7STB1_BRAPC|nr:hypothetical protein BpHYR1_041663 [Brachionus plicatilis]